MLRRCYAPSAAMDRKKRVRFYEKSLKKQSAVPTFHDDDRISVKSTRSEKVTSRRGQASSCSVVRVAPVAPSVVTLSNRSYSRQINTSEEYSERIGSQLHLTTSHDDESDGTLLLHGSHQEAGALDNNLTRDESTTNSEER
jgi:hypothetical protein